MISTKLDNTTLLYRHIFKNHNSPQLALQTAAKYPPFLTLRITFVCLQQNTGVALVTKQLAMFYTDIFCLIYLTTMITLAILFKTQSM